MKKFALALATMTAVATPAFAQDEAPTYSGAHVSGVVGYDKLNLDTAGVENPDGLIFGVNLGYDLQRGKAVFGIEAEATESTAEIKAGNTIAVSASRDLYVGGRVGFVAGGTLIYGKAGYTNARVETLAGGDNGDGFRVGAGVERRFGEHLFGKVEYRYSNYEAGVSRHQAVAGLGVRF